jgi:formylglycine-generating enzyme required for sulfatase activity
MNLKSTLTTFAFFLCIIGYSQTLPTSIIMKDISGGTFTMGSNSLTGSPTQQASAPEHQVTLTSYSLSEAEITNTQYVEFLNAAFADNLIQIVVGSTGPDNGKALIQGTSTSTYNGKTLYSLEGTRVMKDHDNGDGDDNSFTGVIEPENPINIAYIGFDTFSNQFYVKNPHDTTDFNWYNLCTYQNYGATQGTFDLTIQNDFDDWSGAAQNLSNELQGWIETNPSAASNLPTQADVANWPVTFVRWWGAKAFTEYYSLSLPTEAQWEYAAKGGQDYVYGVHDGSDVTDANWNQAGLSVATGHVRTAISGNSNPYGIYNLAGNVWEWTADNYVDTYDLTPVTDPLIEETGSTLRSWRGGSWNYHEATLQSSIRFSDQEDRGNDHFGFRIVRENSTTGIQIQNDEEGFKIYPNPSVGYFQIELSENEKHNIEIYSIEGKLILNKVIQGSSRINIEEWKKGVYLVKTDGIYRKLIIK